MVQVAMVSAAVAAALAVEAALVLLLRVRYNICFVVSYAFNSRQLEREKVYMLRPVPRADHNRLYENCSLLQHVLPGPSLCLLSFVPYRHLSTKLLLQHLSEVFTMSVVHGVLRRPTIDMPGKSLWVLWFTS